MDIQGATLGKDDGALDNVLELAYVSRPVMGGQLTQDGLSQAWDAAVHPLSTVSEKMGCQLRNVFSAFTKRRNMKGKDTQSIVEILTKVSGIDFLFKIAIGRCEDPNVDVASAGVADTLEFVLLNHSEKLRLHRERNFPNFVQKEGAMIGHFKAAQAIGQSPGKCTFDVAKEFALEECVRYGTTIHLDEGPILACTAVMNRAGDEFLPGPALASNQDCRISRSDQLDLPQDVL